MAGCMSTERDSKLARLYKKCGKVYITEAVFNKCMVEVRPLIDVNGLHDYLLKYDLCNDVKKLEGMKKNDRENDPVNNLLCHVSTTGGKHGHFLLYVCLYESTKKGHKSHFDAIEHLQKRAREMDIALPDDIHKAYSTLLDESNGDDSTEESDQSESGYESNVKGNTVVTKKVSSRARDRLEFRCLKDCSRSCTATEYVSDVDHPHPSSSFPWLSVNGESYESFMLENSLIEQTERLTRAFMELRKDTFDSFQRKGIKFEDVRRHIKRLVGTGNYENIVPVSTSPATSCISSTTDYDELEDVLFQKYCSWFNYAIVKEIREEFKFADENKEDVALKDYEDKFLSYCKRRCFESPQKFHPEPICASLKPLVFKIEEKFGEYTLNQVRKMTTTVASVIKCPEYAIYVKSVEEGCVEVSCHILSFAAIDHLSQHQISQLQEHKIFSFKIDDWELMPENSDYEPSELAELSSDSEGYDASSEEESEDFEDDQTDKSRDRNSTLKKFGLQIYKEVQLSVKEAEDHRGKAHLPSATAEEPVASATKQEGTDNAQLSTAERDVRRVESNTTSVAPIESKLTFPYIRFQHLVAEQCQSLCAESEDMVYKFKNLIMSRVAVKLGQLKLFTGELPLIEYRHNLVELEERYFVNDAIPRVFDYCNYCNHRARYKEDFARYGERHIFECPAVVGEMSEEGQANMFVTLDDSFDNCNVNHLYAFVSNLEKVLRMDNMSLQLCRIAPAAGNLKLIFQLPCSVQREIFPLSCDQESALAGLGVVHLSYGDQVNRQDEATVDRISSKFSQECQFETMCRLQHSNSIQCLHRDQTADQMVNHSLKAIQALNYKQEHDLKLTAIPDRAAPHADIPDTAECMSLEVLRSSSCYPSLSCGQLSTIIPVEVNRLMRAGKLIREILPNDAVKVGVRNITAKDVQECLLMSGLCHPNITQFMDVCFVPNCQLPVLLMEKLNESLSVVMESIPKTPQLLKRSILEDIAPGLLYLKHNLQIVHRDLTPKNVLLTSSLSAKITNFGNSHIVNREPGRIAQMLSQNPGTLVYMPSEALIATAHYSPSLDIYSFGLILSTVLQTRFPTDVKGDESSGCKTVMHDTGRVTIYGHSIDDDVGAVMLLGRTGTCTRKNGPGDSIVTGGTRFSIERFIVNSDGFSEAPKFKVTLIDCPGLADTTNVVSEQQDYLRMIGDNKKVNTFCFWLKAGDDVSLIEKLRKCISLDHQTSVALVVSTNFHKMKEPNEDKFPHKGTAVQDEGLHIQVNPSACSKCVGTFKHIMSFTFVHNSENFSNVIPYEELTCHPHFVSTWQSPRPIFEIENCGGCIKVISEYEKKD